MTISLYDLRERLGGVVTKGGTDWQGPTPGHSRKDRGLHIELKAGGFVWNCFNDQTLTHKDLVAYLGIDPGQVRRQSVGERSAREAARRAEAAADRRRKLTFCDRVWSDTVEAEGTPVATYLREVRAIPLQKVPSCLRYHPAAPLGYTGTATTPAMVALVMDAERKPVGIHLTPLTEEGDRADRKKLMFGCPGGGFVPLGPLGPEIAVAEGIETSLAFAHLNGVTTWAALSAQGMRQINLPRGIRRLIVAADSDDSGAGVEAGKHLAERLNRACEVIMLPAPEGTDWADILKESAR